MAAGIFVDKILYTLNSSAVMIISMTFMIFAFIIVLKNAPVDSIKKPITNIEAREQFKRKSIFVIFIFSFIIIVLFILSQRFSESYYIRLIESISLGILWQTITLTKGGISFLNKVDFVLKYIMHGKTRSE
ncbi:accessory gene regulator B family protein [Clostridium sp.]|uniref:accessory gene regulator B family protein n=1 Tax=Clostridium sp. TaxID=1506 RepID=UPI0025C53A7D|nr:accessory gene regulator B family protein [Clostridium sp.]